ncbi:peptidoglycan-binding protein [Rhizobium laguerreae]|nr:peptidoglycan-binding protein [Rhizobium laguerreae]MBY3392088.1 peptidoglycan-binding protein [Rhizobium laguerreae]
MTSLDGGLLAIAAGREVIIVDITSGETVGRIATDGEVVYLQGLDGQNWTQSLAVLTASSRDVETGSAEHMLSIYRTTNVATGFRRTRSLSLEGLDPAFIVIDGEDSIVSWDRGAPKDARLLVEGSFGRRQISTDLPARVVLPTSDSAMVLAVQTRSASLVDVRTGRTVDTITVSEFEASRAEDLVGLSPRQRSDISGAALVLDARSKTLTALEALPGTIPTIGAPARISVADKDQPVGVGRQLLAADGDFQYILVGREGEAAFRVYRRVGTGLERAGTMDLGMPVRVAVALPAGERDGAKTFAFLSADGLSVMIVPDPTHFGATAPDQRVRPTFDPTGIYDSGEQEIMAVQTALAELGYRVGAIDGVFGPATKAAVRAFQFTSGLRVSGDVDTVTIEALATAARTRAGDEGPLSLSPPASINAADYSIYVQFGGAIQRDEINTLTARLLRGGWSVPGEAERLKTAIGLNEVRYGTTEDQPAAEALADILSGLRFSDRTVLAKRVRMVRPGILEAWISR